MPKRKLVAPTDDEPELTLPPNNREPARPDKKHKKSSSQPRRQTTTVKAETVENAESGTTAAPKRSSKKRKVKVEQVETIEAKHEEEVTPEKQRRKKQQVAEVDEKLEGEGNTAEKRVKRKRKTKEEKEAEAMPLAARTVGHKLCIGAHVSAAGGVHKAILNSVHIGANAFALFLKSQRKWANPPLTDEVASSFHANCKTHTYEAARNVVPHGSYLVNLAHTDRDRTKQAYEAFLDDLQRCERLGIRLYNFHPGNSVGNDRAAAIKHLAANINRAHQETKTVVTLLENMAAGGNVLGSTFEDLRDTIALVDDKERVGVCLDTCHAFAAGYDLRSPEAFKETMDAFEEVVGFQYLRALHLNDSKAPLGAHRDLHANIGTGFLGLRAFHNIVNDPRFVGLPLVLETPISQTDDDGEPVKDEKGKQKEEARTWAREIKLLEGLTDMEVKTKKFLALEEALAKKGRKERERIASQIDRKKEKEEKKLAKKPRKRKDEDEESGGEESPLSDLSEDSLDEDGDSK